jgi:hypothetical protein
MSSGVLAACFTPERLSARLPRPGSWHPYPAIQDRAAWDAVHPATRDHLLAQAARLLTSPWPVLTASDFGRFSRDGDRQTYERPYFARRSRLAAAILTAALAGPAPQRVAEVLDGVWLLCEETSWCVPPPVVARPTEEGPERLDSWIDSNLLLASLPHVWRLVVWRAGVRLLIPAQAYLTSNRG